MNNLTLFKSENFGEVLCDLWKNENNEIFMTAEQLGTALGLKNPRKGISNLINRKNKDGVKINEYLTNEEFSSTLGMRTEAGMRDTTVFTEDGIYEVTMISETETAKQFRRWIRNLLKGLRSQELIILQTKLIEQQEQVENYNILTNAQNNLSMLEVAKSLRLGRNKLFKFLREEEILMSAESRKNVPYQPYIDQKYFHTVMGTVINNGKAKDVIITTVTPKGIDFIVKICKKKGLIQATNDLKLDA